MDDPLTDRRPSLRWLVQGLGFAISLLAIGVVVAQVDLQATLRILGQARPLPIAVATAALIMQLGFLAYRWRLLLSVGPGGGVVPMRAVVEALLVGNLANAVLPGRLGEVARALAISRRSSVDSAGSLGVVVLERVLDVSVLASVGLVAALFAGAPTIVAQGLAIVAGAGIVVIVLLMTGLGLRAMGRLDRWASARVARRRPVAVIEWVGRVVEGLHAARQPALVSVALLATVASVMLDGVIFWAVGQGLSVDLSWWQALLLGTAGVLVTGIPSAPANIGTFELAVAWVGAGIGVPVAAGLAVALVAHLIIVLPLSLAGATVLIANLRTLGRAPNTDGSA